MVKRSPAIIEFSNVPVAMAALTDLQKEIGTARFERVAVIAMTAKAIQSAFKKVAAVANKAGVVWIDAERRKGKELTKITLAKGARGGGIKSGPRGSFLELRDKDTPTLKELGVEKKESARAKRLAAIDDEVVKATVEILAVDGKPVNPNTLLAAIRQENKSRKKHAVSVAKFSEKGPFDVVVIDPPWPMQKIDREERPNQDAFDYPVMTEEELAEFWPKKIAPRLKEDVHTFCWTTQKFLPMTLRLLEAWKLKYVLVMVWHKPGGFQPVGLPQYNCEFVVYARKGSPMFIDTKDFPCCFNAPRREHSRKPDYFYDLIRRVTGGSRIDVFSREERKGFAQFGNEVTKYSQAAE